MSIELSVSLYAKLQHSLLKHISMCYLSIDYRSYLGIPIVGQFPGQVKSSCPCFHAQSPTVFSLKFFVQAKMLEIKALQARKMVMHQVRQRCIANREPLMGLLYIAYIFPVKQKLWQPNTGLAHIGRTYKRHNAPIKAVRNSLKRLVTLYPIPHAFILLLLKGHSSKARL